MDIYDDIYVPLEGKELPTIKAEFLLFVSFLNEHNIDYCLGGAIGFCEYIKPRMCTQIDFVLPDANRTQFLKLIEEKGFEFLSQSTDREIGILSKQKSKWPYYFIFSFVANQDLELLASKSKVKAFGMVNLPLASPFTLIVQTLSTIQNGNRFYGSHIELELYDLLKKRLVCVDAMTSFLKEKGHLPHAQLLTNTMQEVIKDETDVKNGIRGLSWGELQKQKAKSKKQKAKSKKQKAKSKKLILNKCCSKFLYDYLFFIYQIHFWL